VAASGVSAAVIKATEGTAYVNPWLGRDLADAAAAGLAVSTYHFARMGNPVAEARFYLATAGLLAQVLDYETNTSVVWARSFLGTLNRAPSSAMTYGSTSTLSGFYQQLPSLAWPAAYNQGYPGWGAMWQYTSSGNVPGITGSVDLSSWHGGETLYDNFFRINAPPPQPPTTLTEDEMTSWTDLNPDGTVNLHHVAGVVNNVAYHWWQPAGGLPGGGPTWNVEVLPL
jgi:hypothetical protein